jgi:glycogen debranching enzyme
LITLHAAWRATGDQTLLGRYLETVEGCLSWIDNYGDRDGDGFQEYQTRSPAGYENMAWKDSGDCVVYPDGSLVKGPKALSSWSAQIRYPLLARGYPNRVRSAQRQRKAGGTL